MRIAPNLVRATAPCPPVNVIHLHHGVWLNLARKDLTAPQFPERIFAAGEEKTIISLPDGFGYRYVASEPWAISFMIHDLLPTPDEVWLTYDIDLVPNAAAPARLREARPIWLDVQNGEPYPVFDVLRGTGTSGQFTYPDDAPDAYGAGPAKNQWVADRDLVLVSTAGHLHPGGLHTDLDRHPPGPLGAPAQLFRSDAVYYEPAGPVSWDVSMTATPPDWRVAVRAGDTLRCVRHVRDGPGVVVRVDGDHGRLGGRRRRRARPVQGVGRRGRPGHPRPAARERASTAAGPPGCPTPPRCPEHRRRPRCGSATSSTAPATRASRARRRIPVVRPGQSLTFVNDDAPIGKGIWHTVTACQAPCNAATGIAYPLANGTIQFDSGELGDGRPADGRPHDLVDADRPAARHVHLLLPHPPVHARCVQRRDAGRLAWTRSTRSCHARHPRTDRPGRRSPRRAHRRPRRRVLHAHRRRRAGQAGHGRADRLAHADGHDPPRASHRQPPAADPRRRAAGRPRPARVRRVGPVPRRRLRRGHARRRARRPAPPRGHRRGAARRAADAGGVRPVLRQAPRRAERAADAQQAGHARRHPRGHPPVPGRAPGRPLGDDLGRLDRDLHRAGPGPHGSRGVRGGDRRRRPDDRAVDALRLRRAPRGHPVRQRRAEPHRRHPGPAPARHRHEHARSRARTSRRARPC